MFGYKQLIQTRIFHSIVIFATAIGFYLYNQNQAALWIPLSTIVCIGPFSFGVSLITALSRFIGCYLAILFAMLIWFSFHHNLSLLLLLLFFTSFCLAYALFSRFFSLFFPILVGLLAGFYYINLYCVDPFICLLNLLVYCLIGFILSQVYEFFLFRKYYLRELDLTEVKSLDNLIIKVWEDIKQISEGKKVSIRELDQLIKPLFDVVNQLRDLKEIYKLGYNNQTINIDLIERYESKLFSLLDWLNSIAYTLLTTPEKSYMLHKYHQDQLYND